MAGGEAERVIDPRNAWIMTSLLKDVIRVGTGTRALSLGRTDLAGKTGTTNENVDAWFCGYNAAMVAVAWIGFDQPRDAGRQRDRRRGGAADLDRLHAARAEGHARRPSCRCRTGIAVAADQRRLRACATTRASLTEYFFGEFPPRARDDTPGRPGTGAARRSRARPAAASPAGRDIRDQIF